MANYTLKSIDMVRTLKLVKRKRKSTKNFVS